jgi:hypothetical protein
MRDRGQKATQPPNVEIIALASSVGAPAPCSDLLSKIRAKIRPMNVPKLTVDTVENK